MELESCYNFEMRKSCRLINQFYESRLSSVSLKVGQFSILRAVFTLGETTNKELQKILILEQTTLTRNLKPLLRDRLLNLSVDFDDKRVKLITLSDAGKKLYLQALPLWKSAQKEFKNKMGKEDSIEILRMAQNIANELSAS